MSFASCGKGMTQIWNLIIVKMFNESIARTVTLVDWCDLGKDIKLICNTFIWDLIVEFYSGTKKKPF
jgi:hypothetical protein